MSSVTILGGGGHGSDVLAVIEALAGGSRFDHVLVADDQFARRERFEDRSVELVDGLANALDRCPRFVSGIGDPSLRRLTCEKVGASGLAVDVLVHRSADIGAGFRAGAGSVVFGQVWVSPRVQMGMHVHVSYGTTIGHDSLIGDFTGVMPGCGIAGDVDIGTGVMVGAGAMILQGLRLGDGAVIGAGAVVTKNVAPGATVVGVPARQVG